MPLPNDKVSFTCTQCNKSFALTYEVLTRRRTCTYCGTDLAVPPEVDAAIAQFSSVRGVKVTTTLALNCPLCLRPAPIASGDKDLRHTCKVCSCPFRIGEDGKPVISPDPARMPPMPPRLWATVSCPQCWMKKLRESAPDGRAARCAACKAEANGATVPLETFCDLQPRPQHAFIIEAGQAVLKARWKRVDLGLDEAFQHFHELNAVDAWDARADEVFSPLSPQMSADIVQHAVWAMPGNMVIGSSDVVEFEMELEGRANYSVKGEACCDDDSPPMQQAMRYLFYPGKGGTKLGVKIRDFKGEFHGAPEKYVVKVEKEIRRVLPKAARQYCVFKTLYGSWVGGTTLSTANETMVSRRLHDLQLGPKFNLADLAKLLIPRKMLDAKELNPQPFIPRPFL